MTIKTQQFYYNLLLQGYMFRLLRVIIKPSNEPTQDYLCTGLKSSRSLKRADFKTLAHEGGKVVNPTLRPPLTRTKYSLYPFLLEADLIPGP